ncbi:hypothetical protein O7626_40550 [Micromonospora sp. WMMD1102]|uniref:hypothetical protein n=1 Tax=Micromonospora sp. WMMD1102 TaxID=3016105 RepID=UPI00241548C3|nr:hypothetical protein [Micromonospora sp. WMMD1102]MDG4792108.1 hypothetical protein [Micromonospora sp. WMMD1102]
MPATFTCRTCGAGLSSADTSDDVAYFHSGPADHAAVPRLQHQPVPASDLRDGDLMRVGSSTNYVLVADAQPVNDLIVVTIYNGQVSNSNGATLRFAPDDTVFLSMRDAKP